MFSKELKTKMLDTFMDVFNGRPPSGNLIRIVRMNMERLENGKIVEHWSYPDKLAALHQIRTIQPRSNRRTRS
jgi:predicted ester cyclase